jgi:hypothetical protein
MAGNIEFGIVRLQSAVTEAALGRGSILMHLQARTLLVTPRALMPPPAQAVMLRRETHNFSRRHLK